MSFNTMLTNPFVEVILRFAFMKMRHAKVACLLLALSMPWAHADIVINEIHYHPDVKTEPASFIELYNRGTNTVDLSGWYFSSGISYTFASGTQLAPDQYLVVAQNPTFLATEYQASALGPYQGNLSNEGERLVLRNAQGGVEDEVEYGASFPWPIVGDAPGYSIELLNPNLDNNLGGSWRSWSATSVVTNEVVVNEYQTNQVPVFTETKSWRYDQSGDDLGTLWRGSAYADQAWPEGSGLFYREESSLPWAKTTPLTYTSPQQMTFYFRTWFNVAEDSVGALEITTLLDDGAVFYINGVELGRLGMQTNDVVNYQTPASRNVGNATEPEVVAFELKPEHGLTQGTNLLSVEVHQSNNQSSDVVFGMRLTALQLILIDTYTNYVVVTNTLVHGPTPGKRNGSYSTLIPPQIRQVAHHPKQPQSGQAVPITAKVTDSEGVQEVVLEYQIVSPGAYIELNDAAYNSDWIKLAMTDDGTGGDEVAGDDVYTVTIPADVQQHRRLIRYRITAKDTQGTSVRVPYQDDPQPNFAYMVYDGVPAWKGAARPGITSVQTFDTNIMNSLPVYHLISKKTSVENATWIQQYGGDEYLWWGTLVYDGEVYDHIRYRMRGGVWRYSMGKNMWKLDMNRGHNFQARDNFGKTYKTKWSKLNLGACIQQGDYGHRGEQGMFESVGLKLFNLAGVEAPYTHWIQYRIIDEAVEASATSQYTGDFWGLYLAIEQEDGKFLDEHDLPDGNLYKMDSGAYGWPYGDLNNQGSTAASDKSDLATFVTQYSQTSPAPGDAWWRTNLDVNRYYNYQAIVQGIHHYDIGAGKNYFYYLNPTNGIWSEHPWDLDLTWADNMFDAGGQGADPFKNRVLTRTVFNLEYKNRVRELRDLLFNDEQAGQLIDEYAAAIYTPAGGLSFVDADRAQWDYNPIMVSSYVNSGKAGQGRFYQFPYEPTVPKTFLGTIQLMKNYVKTRSTLLDSLASDAAIPGTPVLTYAGPTNYPVNRLSFRSSAFSSSGGSFGGMKWRLAEITPASAPVRDPENPRKYEIETDWETQELQVFSQTMTIPAEEVKVGHAYRVRARMKDTAGRWSHWSAPVEFVAGETDMVAELQSHLRISELMYNPPEGTDYEYLELVNTSDTQTLDLSGVRFTQGIDYTFPSGVTLPPGRYLLVVRGPSDNQFAAFRSYYGLDNEVLIQGPYAGFLDNKGETITLKTSGNGTVILSFTYGDGRGWPVAADGTGHSLVADVAGNYDYPGNWRSSVLIKGSPGASESVAPVGVVLNEIMAHTDYSDPAHAGFDSNDWIELYNPLPDAVSLEGYYLSDDASALNKWAIPSQVVPPYGHIVFDEVTGFHQYLTNGFGLSKAGDQVFLSCLPGNGQDRVVDSISFKGQDRLESIGRYPDGGPAWGSLVPSRGGSNGPVCIHLVINEFMYHPPMTDTNQTDNTLDEYVEIFNPTGTNVMVANETGAWRMDGCISYSFPTNLVMPPGGVVVLVNFDPSDAALMGAFKERYALTNGDTLFLGPYGGKLANDSGRIAIEKPEAPDVPGDAVSWIIQDEVIYSDSIPWDTRADGLGLALRRIRLTGSGNTAVNWDAADPTPGRVEIDEPLLMAAPRQAPGSPFAIRLYGPNGRQVILDSSTNLVNWSEVLRTNLQSGGVEVMDSNSVQKSTLFYRARMQ